MNKTEIFTRVPVRKVPRNMFDLSHEVKMSGKFGWLYPVLLQECMPGDSMHDQMTAMVRFAPMLSPIMHRCNVKSDAFFVPMRLITNHWETFITGGPNGTSEPVLPYVTPAGIVAANGTPAGIELMGKRSLWNYLGLPPMDPSDEPDNFSVQKFSALPFRACQKIYNDWFRDPNLQSDVELDLTLQGDVSAQTSAPDGGILTMRRRGWERDAFTGALPFAQRGPAVLVPFSGIGETVAMNVLDGDVQLRKTLDQSDAAVGNVQGIAASGDTYLADSGGAPISIVGQKVEVENGESTINDLRTAYAIQRWLENNARGGARYNEQILAHYGETVPDYRLQRAEYLGGGRQVVQISQVLSTAEGATVPVGDMAGHGISVGKSNKWKYRCKEHGYIVMFVSVVPVTAYMQGVDKMWFRENRYDFAFPEFANLGEQEVKSKEVFYSFDVLQDANNDLLFGYNPRYWEYKFKQDRVAGDFTDNLLFWHLTRKFLTRPSLDADFVTMIEDYADEESSRRIFAVQDGTDYLWMQLFHRFTAKRPLPYFGVPQLNG